MLPYNLTKDWPYSTEGLPGIGGRLRQQTQDFIVEEVPLYAPSDQGQHLYVNLTKEGLTTKEVQFRLAELFGLSRGDVGFAGLKDKFARTTQTFSLSVGHQSAMFAAEAREKIAEHLGRDWPVTVHWARFHANKLKPGHLLGNRFTINVTELACSPNDALERAKAIAASLHARGAPNYFGPQRFGSQGSNVTQGLNVLAGRTRKRDRWLRKFLISSVQSYVCNCYLARRLEDGLFDRLMTGDVAKKYATGGMFVVEDLAAEQPRYAAQEISFTAPIFGAKMKAAEAEAGEFEQQILDEFDGLAESLAQAKIEGTRRLGRLLPQELTIRPYKQNPELDERDSDEQDYRAESDDTGIQISFFLPKGAFATTLLREFMKSDSDAIAAIDKNTDD
jgi:tRNA pseudouridine13 synthase